MRESAPAAVDGCGPDDQDVTTFAEDQALAVQLRPPVDREGRRLVSLDVGLVVRPVEDEVRREVDERRAASPARVGDVARTFGIDRERLRRLRLRPVYRVVGGA